MRDKWVCLAESHRAVKPQFHLPSEKKNSLRGSHLALSCALIVGVDVGKVKLFFLPIPMHQNLFLFPSNRVLKFLLWEPGLPQRLSCPWGLTQSVFSRYSQTVAKKDWYLFTLSSMLHRLNQSPSAYNSMHRRAKNPPGSLVVWWGSHISQGYTFFCSWTDINR